MPIVDYLELVDVPEAPELFPLWPGEIQWPNQKKRAHLDPGVLVVVYMLAC